MFVLAAVHLVACQAFSVLERNVEMSLTRYLFLFLVARETEVWDRFCNEILFCVRRVRSVASNTLTLPHWLMDHCLPELLRLFSVAGKT